MVAAQIQGRDHVENAPQGKLGAQDADNLIVAADRHGNRRHLIAHILVEFKIIDIGSQTAAGAGTKPPRLARPLHGMRRRAGGHDPAVMIGQDHAGEIGRCFGEMPEHAGEFFPGGGILGPRSLPLGTAETCQGIRIP